MVDEGGAAGGEPLGEDPQVATVADVHRNPDDDDYLLDIAGEEEVTTQDKEKDKEDVEEMRKMKKKMKKKMRRMMKRKMKG